MYTSLIRYLGNRRTYTFRLKCRWIEKNEESWKRNRKPNLPTMNTIHESLRFDKYVCIPNLFRKKRKYVGTYIQNTLGDIHFFSQNLFSNNFIRLCRFQRFTWIWHIHIHTLTHAMDFVCAWFSYWMVLIQSFTHCHRLRSEYNKRNVRKSSKKQWHVNNINGTWQKPNYARFV